MEDKLINNAKSNDNILEYKLDDYKQYYIVKNVIDNSVTSLIIPSTYNNLKVIEIKEDAFEDCVNLKDITIPDSINKFGKNAFYGCENLENVYYDGTIDAWCNIYFKEIYDDEIDFDCAYELTGYSNPMSYASHFFLKDKSGKYKELTSIVIPDVIIEIGINQFYGFNNITNVILSKNTKSIHFNAFTNCTKLTNIIIPEGLEYSGNSFINCTSLKLNDYDNGYYLGNNSNPFLVLVRKKSKDILSCKINENTKVISASAFENCQSLTSIVIPPLITSIPYYVFRNCSKLKNVILPLGLIEIGCGAFGGCCNLKNITIPNSVKKILPDAFYFCSKLSNFMIPDEVSSINMGTFANCESLKSIVISKNITFIEQFAFWDCKNLESVFYKGDKDLWDWMTIQYDNEPLENANIYFYREEKPIVKGNYWHYLDDIPTIWN